MSKVIVCSNYNETLITTVEHEARLIRDWFTRGDRDLDDYDREEAEIFEIESRTHIQAE